MCTGSSCARRHMLHLQRAVIKGAGYDVKVGIGKGEEEWQGLQAGPKGVLDKVRLQPAASLEGLALDPSFAFSPPGEHTASQKVLVVAHDLCRSWTWSTTRGSR